MELSALGITGPQPHVQGRAQVRLNLRALNPMWISYALLGAAAVYLSVTASESPAPLDQNALQVQAHEQPAEEGRSADSLIGVAAGIGRS